MPVFTELHESTLRNHKLISTLAGYKAHALCTKKFTVKLLPLIIVSLFFGNREPAGGTVSRAALRAWEEVVHLCLILRSEGRCRFTPSHTWVTTPKWTPRRLSITVGENRSQFFGCKKIMASSLSCVSTIASSSSLFNNLSIVSPCRPIHRDAFFKAIITELIKGLVCEVLKTCLPIRASRISSAFGRFANMALETWRKQM